MFTGIIEELGAVESIEGRAAGARLKVLARKVLEDVTEGASIAVNGVCLTAVDIQAESFSADLAPETLRASNLGELTCAVPRQPGTAALAGQPPQRAHRAGHVDGDRRVLSLESLGDENWWLKVRIPAELDPYLVYKGSIAIDGISLTIASLEGGVLRPSPSFRTPIGIQRWALTSPVTA